MRLALISAIAACVIANTAVAQSQTLNGVGTAPISKDVEGVRAAAEQSAKEDLVRALARQTIGAERLGEVTPDMVSRLANQIRADMIVDRSAERVGQTFKVTLSARIDTAWFQAQLDNEGIQLSSDRAGGDTQAIFVMIDQNTGPARDTDKPAEIVTEYDHNAGSDFRDKSVAAYSEKDKSAQSYRVNAAASASARSAAGYSAGGESAAATSRATAASAVSAKAAAASSHSEAAIDKTDVAASVHDDTHYYQKVVYQSSANTGPAQAARTSLGAALMKYSVAMANSDIELSSFFRGAPPTYSNLKASTHFEPFLVNLSQKNVAPFFMGGTLRERDNGHDPATGQAMCTGDLEAAAFATNNSFQIAASTPNATASGANFEDCEAKLSQNLAAQAAAEMGPQIQSYWRKQLRRQAQTIASAGNASADYTLTVRGASLTMDMQADLMDALTGISGVEKQVFLGQAGNQISFQVRYGGPMPLQMALYQKLRANPAFAQMRPTTQGQSIVICLSACSPQ
jgi:hypothetical protein